MKLPVTYDTPENLQVSKRGFPKYAKNPSVPQHLDSSVKTRRISGVEGNYMIIADPQQGNIAAEARPAGFYTVDFVDKERFVKLFLDGVRAFSGLSAAGIKVFEVLYREVQKHANIDTILINYEQAAKVIKMSRPVFFKGIKELLNKGFIFESVIPYQYFVNINYIFNGNRLAFVKEYHLKEKKNGHDRPPLPGFEEHLEPEEEGR